MRRFRNASHALTELSVAAADRARISSYTHNFYRYPARFSAKFAAAAINCFSRPGDLIADPYMGGGTVVVEALAAGRRVIGNDLNSLAVFVARAKTTPLTNREVNAIRQWISDVCSSTSYAVPSGIVPSRERTRNLSIPRGRFIKKVIALKLGRLHELPTPSARRFARCVILRAGQSALDGRRTHTSLREFRLRLQAMADEMLLALVAFHRTTGEHFEDVRNARVLCLGDAADIHALNIFTKSRRRVSLVVTSPPYPGVHVLYHRWQVDGRKESPAPYWIIDGRDGESAFYHTFGDRRQSAIDEYFVRSLQTLRSIRRIMRRGAVMVQLVAFANPTLRLARYLENMALADFEEVTFPELASFDQRIWRDVPNRKWHAARKGLTSSAREVVLIHRAI